MRRIKPALPEPPKATKPPLPGTVTKFAPPWLTGTPGPVAVATLADNAEIAETDIHNFEHVHPRTQAIRRLFVAEFVKDFNMSAAMLRLGLNYSQPAMVATKWLKEPFTQFILDRFIRESEDEALVTRQHIIAALVREANNYGLDSSGASRVSALGKLAKIKGMEIDRSQVDVRVAGGIMLIPVTGSPDDWERSAQRAQLELKQAASA